MFAWWAANNAVKARLDRLYEAEDKALQKLSEAVGVVA
jgi:hypothetical protein